MRVGLIAPPPGLRLGATITASARLGDEDGAILMPATALTTSQGQPAVWVLDGKAMTVNARNIRIARYDLAQVAVAGGLAPVEVIVTAGVQAFFALGRAEDPPFTFRTMVVRAVWPGATVEETLKQVTERLEWRLQEVPNLDNLCSFTRAGDTTTFVDLTGSTQGRDVADTWYQVRKKAADIRHTLPPGLLGPFFNDEFGDTLRIIYAFASDGFTHRELRDALEGVRSELLTVADRMLRLTATPSPRSATTSF